MSDKTGPGWYALALLLAWLMIIFLANRVGDLSRRLNTLESQRVEKDNQ